MRYLSKKFICYLCTLFGISVFSAIFLAQITGVSGQSMEPELSDGQSVFVNKLVYKMGEPQRFDVIVFRYLYEDDAYYIKRIVGLPGETVEIKDGALYIDGERLSEPYAAVEDGRRAAVPVELGKDEYFVLGDNRDYSSDSRDYDVGNVKKVQILGKASAKIWPFRLIGHGKDNE